MNLNKKIPEVLYDLTSSKLIKWVVFPCILLMLWFSLSLVWSSYKSFTVLQYVQNQDENNNFFEKRLLKNQKLSGEFEAKENNLGIIAVKFGKVPKIDFDKEDTIIFRIKERDQAKWFYENKYKSGLVRSYQYLTFGFIPIQNSKGKTYKFEIVSLSGNNDNAMETSDTNPIYLSKYKFSKSEVFENWRSFGKFMTNKILTFYTDYDTLVSSSLFLLPFIFYLTLIILVPNYVVLPHRLKRKFFVFLVLILIFFYILFFEDSITGFTLGLLGLWVIAIYVNNFKSRVTFILASMFIFLSFFILYFNWTISIDKISTFAYMLIIIALVQSMHEKQLELHLVKKEKRSLRAIQ